MRIIRRDRRDRQLTLRVAAIACVASCLLVALDLWGNRDGFDPEGISYLDMADAYCRGDWRAALVGLWSPLYPWLLALMMLVFHPSAQWEFTAVHALNFLIYLVTLASFSIFMRELLRANKATAANERTSRLVLARFRLFLVYLVYHPTDAATFARAGCDRLCPGLLNLRHLVPHSKGELSWGESIFLGALLALGIWPRVLCFRWPLFSSG